MKSPQNVQRDLEDKKLKDGQVFLDAGIVCKWMRRVRSEREMSDRIMAQPAESYL